MLRIPKTSTVPEKESFYSSLLERCVSTVVEAVGEENIRGVLMIGAPARSEATVIELPRGMYSLSDVDLICACRAGTDPAYLRPKLVDAVARLNREIGTVCSGVDVSMKTEDQLTGPAPAIANYELVRSPVAVWGDERVTSTLGDVDIADVPGEESLKLIHNRMLEELLAGKGPRTTDDEWLGPILNIYATAKLVLDSITAYLFLRNNVPTSFTDRVRYFVDDVLERRESEGLRDALAGHIESLPSWALFKTTGSLDGLVSHFGPAGTPSDLERMARTTWDSTIGYAEVLWRAVLTDVSRIDVAGLGMEKIGGVFERLESFPRSFVRAFRMLRSGRADGILSPLGTLSRARLASPRLLVYFVAVAIYLSYSESVEWGDARRLVLKYGPFNLGPGASRLSDDDMRAILTERIAEYHHAVLLGRKGGNV
jgi:hypothetical protein